MIISNCSLSFSFYFNYATNRLTTFIKVAETHIVKKICVTTNKPLALTFKNKQKDTIVFEKNLPVNLSFMLSVKWFFFNNQ